MKTYEPESITERRLKILKSKPAWKNIEKDGPTVQYIEAESEIWAEIARYGENMRREMCWDLSRNFPSVRHMSGLVGKKYDRKRSAIGTIIVAHSAPTIGTTPGSNRFEQLGVTNFNIDAESEYDDGEKDSEKANLANYNNSLTPYLNSQLYSVPIGAMAYTRDGQPFTVAEQKTIKSWNQKWSTVSSTMKRLTAFKAAGGWENYKYLVVPVVQGIPRTVQLGESDNSAHQVFTVDTLDIEAADSYYTQQFLFVEVETKEETQIWSEVYHLSTVGPTDKRFEITISPDRTGTHIIFGDGINGAIPPKGAIITLHYLETLGEAGNVTDSYAFQSISGVDIPLSATGKPICNVGCQNMWAVIGGKNLEEFEEYKANSETAYAKNYDVLHTIPELYSKINSISPIPLWKVGIKSYMDSETLNNSKVYINKIGVTGLSGKFKKLNSVETSLFNQIMNQVINEKVLSRKQVVYVDPNLIKIKSKVEIELKSPVVSKEALESQLEDKLYSALGKYNEENITKYEQVLPIKEVLSNSNNISSIDSVDMLELDASAPGLFKSTSTKSNAQDLNSNSPATDLSSFFLIFNFKSPTLNINQTGVNGRCLKDALDGCPNMLLFNLVVGNKKVSYILRHNQNSSTDGTGDPEAFQADDMTAENSSTTLNRNSSGAIYTLYKCADFYETLGGTEQRKDITNSTGLIDISKFTVDEKVFFTYSWNATELNFIIGLPITDYTAAIGYDSFNNLNNVFKDLLSQWDNGIAYANLSFFPTDKTVETVDWNTIMYYDKVDVTIL